MSTAPIFPLIEEETSTGPFSSFPDQVREDVEGLLHLGYLTDEVEFCGHEFGLRTLRSSEEIAASAVTKPYMDTRKEPEAYMQAIVGLALTHVDAEENFCPPIGPGLDSFAKARFNYAGQWFPPTIDFLYQAYGRLVQRQLEAIRAMQDFSSRNLPKLSPSVGSLNVPGISSDETTSDTQR